MSVYVVFDDTNKKSEVICDVIGENGFADVVVKKKKLETYYLEHILEIYPEAEWHCVRSVFEFNEIARLMEKKLVEETRVLHLFSNCKHATTADFQDFLTIVFFRFAHMRYMLRLLL